MPNWDRINVWTNTLYALIQALSISNQIQFGNLPLIDDSVRGAARWISPDCSYSSVLITHPFGDRKIKFRRDPNKHFGEIAGQVIKMLIQDLVVIFDEMMKEILVAHGKIPANYPQSKVEQLKARLGAGHEWAAEGCLELIAVRNVLTHSEGFWNVRSINLIKGFIKPVPLANDKLIIGFPMLFRYRKAIRTFLNQVA